MGATPGPTASDTTIVLADDHHIVRHGLRALLEREPDFTIAGEASDGSEVVDLVERVHPDVLILDLVMPGLHGLEVTRHLTASVPQTRIVVLSMHANEGYVLEALRNGAAAYVLKEATSTELVTAVREVVAGHRYLSPPLSERAITAYLEKASTTSFDLYDTLTAREREVLQLAAEGYTSSRIAARLSISPRTAETHRANLMRKLGLRTHADLIRYALRRETSAERPHE
jgi:two-component system, NarL family, response regulator NreC